MVVKGTIGIIIFAVAFPVFAGGDGSSLTWDDAPNPIQIRHLGDWMVDAGWYTPEDVYGPFIEEPFEVGDETQFAPAMSDIEEPRNTYTLFYKSEAAYFWFAKGTAVDPDALAAAADYFDHTIQPFVRSIFGEEAFPGIDGDPRLHIVHDPYLGYGAVGVFRPEDQCPRVLCPTSNQRDVIYYSLDWGEVNSQEYLTTLAHEYQHVIRYTRDGNEHRWMNEGLSQLAEHLSGFAPRYSVGENLNSFLEHTDNRLDGWADFSTDPGIYYGSSYLFLVYLYERFGLDFVKALSASPYDGLAAVHHTLKDFGSDLDSVFTDWLIANYLDDPFVGDGRYYYSTLSLPVQVKTSPIQFPAGSPAVYNRDINQYGSTYFELSPGTYNILFDGADETPIIDVNPYSGAWVWWSYNAEASATRLTRRIDLTAVDRATLQYGLWYNTEADYDWGDVQVSLDEGQHWKTLSTEVMNEATDMIPVIHYDGRSNGWLTETIDLTPFIGSTILLRFEYVTDGTLSWDGILLDDITIPEIGFFDDVETLDEGWQVDGFVRIPATVQQNWSVVFINKGKTPTVDILSQSMQTTITVPEGGGVLIIGAMAPMTAEKTTYKLVVEPVE